MNQAKRSLFSSPPVSFLFGFASISTAVLSSIAILSIHRRERNIRSEPYYKETMRIWKNSEPAKFLIGEPIKLQYVEFNNKKNEFTKEKANFVIPFKGQNYNGEMNVKATCNEDKWTINELSLELDSDLSDKKFILYRETNSDSSKDLEKRN